MGSAKLNRIKFNLERRAKNTRRVDVYVIVLAVCFIATFILTQIMLGIHSV